MLFKTKFHQGIRDGSITLTFRAWKSARVKIGNQYRFGSDEGVEVDSVDEVVISAITDKEASHAGFMNTAELCDFLRKNSAELSPESTVFRVCLHYVKIPRPVKVELALEEIGAKLARMDRLSRHGPWTKQTLEIIAQNPRTSASKLAPMLGRETQPFKADVRKLKKLGLTVSFDIGYEITKSINIDNAPLYFVS